MPRILKFTVSPLNPVHVSYNSYWEVLSEGSLICHGAYIPGFYPRRLRDQFDQDKTVLSQDFIDSPPPPRMDVQWWRLAGARLAFRTDATEPSTYILEYYLKGISGARAAFYINGALFGSSEVIGDETIEIPVVCPQRPRERLYAYMLGEGHGIIEFKKIQCYIE